MLRMDCRCCCRRVEELTKGAKTGDYQLITDTARSFVEKIQNARNNA